jgi:hypothetical protein
MKAPTQESAKSSWTAVVAISALVVIPGLWLLARWLDAPSHTPADRMRWVALAGLAATGIVVVRVLAQGIHENRAIRLVVAEDLRGRPPMTNEAFGRRFYEPSIAPVATQLRRLLAEDLESDLAGMIPTDDFEKWLYLFPGPDSAADTFFGELAVEFQLRRDCPWPERFGSFDALVKFVTENALADKTLDARHNLSSNPAATGNVNCS